MQKDSVNGFFEALLDLIGSWSNLKSIPSYVYKE